MAANGEIPRKRGHAQAFNYQSEGEHTYSPPHRRHKHTNDKHYSVEVQRVSIKKKKHTYEDSYTDKSPEGYHYLPVGYRRIKEYCREQCLKQNRLYYVVSLFPNPNKIKHDTNLITKNIYRHGWHFPLDVIFAAFAHFHLMTSDQVGHERNTLSNTINIDDEGAMEEKLIDIFKDLFPAIPDSDVSLIIDHAFRKGTKRIGNALDVTVIRRVQLAVLAHIRHVYTDYDKLLKRGETRSLARYHIERKCLSKLLKWRGEDDEFDLETRTEEVIIIDDDEDSEDETDDEVEAFGYSTRALQSGTNSDLELLGSPNLRSREHRFAQNLPPAFFNPGIATLLSQDYRGQYGPGMQPPTGNGHFRGENSMPLDVYSSVGHLETPFGRAGYLPNHFDSGRIARSQGTSPHFSGRILSQAHEPPAGSRHVSVLLRSPMDVPSVVYDRTGQPFRFDPSLLLVTPIQNRSLRHFDSSKPILSNESDW